MSKIFLSHSSKDKEFARQLAEDLKDLGHNVWVDEWEIRVGDSIVAKIDQGIGQCEYLIIVLSPDAVESGWVEQEWQSKYWHEIQEKRTLILPALIKDCSIPNLLAMKKYADFRHKYAIGLAELVQAIAPVLQIPSSDDKISIQNNATDTNVAKLIGELQSRVKPLSQCLAEALGVALKYNNSALEKFCRNELSGWSNVDGLPDNEKPEHRLVQTWVVTNPINMQYIGWGGSVSSIITWLQQDPNTMKVKMCTAYPVSKLESDVAHNTDPNNRLLSFTATLREILPSAPDNIRNVTVYAYMRGDAHHDLLEAIRAELTKKLLALLPTISI